MQVTPGPDGTTDWWARLPAGRSAAAWAAIRELGEEYAGKDPALSLDQARADAFMDLLLTNVTVTTKLTLGIPVITGPDADHARDTAAGERASESQTSGEADATCATNAGSSDGDTAATAAGEVEPAGSAGAATDAEAAWRRPAVATGGRGLGGKFSLSAALFSGCEIPGIGFIDADTVEALLTVVPTDIGRALLDARTGTLMESVTTAYRPPKSRHRLRDHPRRHLPDVGLQPPRHHTATSTTPGPGPTDPPPPPTSPGSAAATTDSNNAAAGPTSWPPTAPPPGPHPPGKQTHHPTRPRRPATTTTT